MFLDDLILNAFRLYLFNFLPGSWKHLFSRGGSIAQFWGFSFAHRSLFVFLMAFPLKDMLSLSDLAVYKEAAEALEEEWV